MTWKSTNQDSPYLGILFHRIWGKKVAITYYLYIRLIFLYFSQFLWIFSYTCYNYYTWVTYVASVILLFCYIGGLSKKCTTRVGSKQRKRTLNVTYSLILHWIQTSSASLSDWKKMTLASSDRTALIILPIIWHGLFLFRTRDPCSDQEKILSYKR